MPEKNKLSLENLIIPENVKRTLVDEILASRVAHAYIFEGSDKDSKMNAALEFARTLNCEKGTGCGKCRPCVDIGKMKYPDLMIFRSSTSVKIEDIREFIKFMSLSKARASGWKIGIIADAELLTPEAENSLLKITEEPPASSCVILITSNLHALLPTIRSRCQILRFPPADYRRAEYDREEIAALKKLVAARNYAEYFEKVREFLDADDPREKTAETIRGILFDLTESFRRNPSAPTADKIDFFLNALKWIKKQRSPKSVLDRIFFNEGLRK
ncbi:MAG: hypothetical protein J7L54_07005 [Elusimicrobia bacterium]|nr:hypothetical protein [Elusimicrobiota bacterium]